MTQDTLQELSLCKNTTNDKPAPLVEVDETSKIPSPTDHQDYDTDTTNSLTTSEPPPVLPQELAAQLFAEDQILASARILQKLNYDDLTKSSIAILETANELESFVSTVKNPPPSDWKHFTETHDGGRPTTIYYKIDDDMTLNAKIETRIEESLLKPFLSVLNETELYETFIPRWNKPKLGVKRSIKIRQTGRVSQIILVTIDVPWPLPTREVVIKAQGMDDIDANGDILVKIDSLQTGDEDGLIKPPEDKNTVRSDVHGGFLFRRFRSEDFVTYDKHGKVAETKKGAESEGGDDRILVTFLVQYKAGESLIPKWLIDFVVKFAIGRIWNRFLTVAEDVRDGKRPKHGAVIEEKKETLYDWVDARVHEMLSFLPASSGLQNT